jgi:hypothetical protein
MYGIPYVPIIHIEIMNGIRAFTDIDDENICCGQN